jgi:uncharacterized protein YkwD
MLRLRIADAGTERVLPVAEGPVVVGRGENADVLLTEKRASREHLEITPAPGGVIVRDLDSTNGTFVGERRILLARLWPGDAVTIGDAVITLLADEPKPGGAKRALAPALLRLLGPALLLFLLVEAGLHAIASSRAKELERAEEEIERVEFLLAKNDPDPRRSLAALTEFLRRRPGSAWTAEAEGTVGVLTRTVSRSDEAVRELSALLDGSAGRPASEMEHGLRRVIEGYSDVPEVTGLSIAALAGLSERKGREQGVRYVSARDEAESLAEQGEFGRACSTLLAFSAQDPAAAAASREDLRRMEGEIYRRAEESYRDLLLRAEVLEKDGKHDLAATLLRDEAPRFNGTRYAPILRRRAEAGATVSRRGEDRRTDRVDLGSQRRALDLLATQAEELAAARMFRAAADRYAEIIPDVSIPELREEFERRERDLREVDGLLGTLAARIAERGRAFGPVELRGGKFLVLGIEGDRLDLEFSGQRVSRPWSSLSPEEVLSLLRKAQAGAGGTLSIALYCALTGLREPFEAEILSALGRAETSEEAGRLWARRRGVEYPEGGFVAFKGRILTRKEHAEEVNREQIASLREQQGKLHEKVREHPSFRRLGKLLTLRVELDKAREYALALIFDEVKYFYPYRDRMAEYEPVQREVDVRIAAVKAIWDDPLRVSVKPDAALESLLGEVKAASDGIRALGVDASDFEHAIAGLTMYVGLTFGVRDIFMDETERGLLAYDRNVMEYNRTATVSSSALERRQVEITNEYRLMMGRRALVIDDRLVRCARGHSEEMSKEGYFSHFSPHPERKTPDLRAKICGYTGIPLSENIHAGSGDPESAHRGWLHSSGHHRNILQKFWTDMGTGQGGKYWTQNFGRTAPMKFPK